MKKKLKALLAKGVRRRRIQTLRSLASNLFGRDWPVAIREPENGKVVALAPHMDDETLGCGGTIARHAQAGAQVVVVFLTDGSYGGASTAILSGEERNSRERELINTRQQEARCAVDILGVQSCVFLDAKDTQLSGDRQLSQRLRAVLEQERPSFVYLPFFLEQHPDHRAVSSLLLAAVTGTALDFECRGYEVWTPLLPNCVVNIDPTIELKKRALACYRSQLANVDYLHIGTGLSAYRSLALGGKLGSYAEAFHALPLSDYRRLCRAAR